MKINLIRQTKSESKIYIVYQKALILALNISFSIKNKLCEFPQHHPQRLFLKPSFKDFRYTKINQTLIWYDKFNQYNFNVKNSTPQYTNS